MHQENKSFKLNSSFHLNLNCQEKRNIFNENENQINYSSDSILYVILTWTILFLTFKKCLNV